MQPEAQGEVAQVVGGELEFPAFGGSGQFADDDAGVVDQEVQWPAPAASEIGNRGAVDQVQRSDVQGACGARSCDVLGDFCAGVGIADRQGDLGAGAGE